MARKPIAEEYLDDYFAYISRETRSRRRSAVVREEKAAWQREIDDAFKAVITELEWPDYIGSHSLAQAYAEGIGPEFFRMNMQKSMARIGYTRVSNPDSKDGRWKFCGMKFFIYRKNDAPNPTKNELKKRFG